MSGISEKKAEEIRKEAKKILDSFGKSLERIKFKEKSLKREEGGFREEGSGESGDEEFRNRMFENAKNKEGEFIIAEKKKW